MKLAILHISDIHITKGYCSVFNRIKAISESFNVLNKLDAIIIAITGDIVDNGKPEEYEVANKFIEKLKEVIENVHKISNIEVIIIPGNHDITLTLELPCCTREFLRSLIKNKEKLEDCLKTRRALLNNFYDFSSKYNSFLSRGFYDEHIFEFDKRTIVFRMVNGVILSTLDDNKGSQYFNFDDNSEINQGGLNITLLHYPEEWFDDDCKKLLEDKLLYTADILLMGHEHESKLSSTAINDEIEYKRLNGGQLTGEVASDSSY